MSYKYESLCPNCGKVVRSTRNFCNMDCKREYYEKKRALDEKYKISHTLTPPKTPEDQCQHCRYGCYIGGTYGCVFFEITGHTRHSLHPEGLPDECQEHQRKRRGRKSKTIVF